MNQSYCYSFRFCCDPGFNDRREIASLRRFVREAQIDDVAVFCNVEELNTGHMTEEEQETIWLRLLCDVQAALAPEGVQLSVNHWHSLMHADLGKTLPQSQPFRRMVDMDGREADLCVCPMCERWQTYFAGLYARYAALSPHILWVEDDFRLHNHDPLRWGGCFCPAHMREYARRAGTAFCAALPPGSRPSAASTCPRIRKPPPDSICCGSTWSPCTTARCCRRRRRFIPSLKTIPIPCSPNPARSRASSC